MSFRLPAYLHRNRHGMLYFRLTVPPDLRPIVGQAEIYRSLGSASVRLAADRAQTLRITLQRLFSDLREGGKQDMNGEAYKALRALLDQRKITARHMEQREDLESRISAMKSEQFRMTAEHGRMLEAVQKAQAAAGGEVVKAGDSPAPVNMPPMKTGATGVPFSQLFEAFCRFKEGAGEWRDPESDRLYRYGPIVREFIACVGDVADVSLDAGVIRTFKQTTLGRADFSQAKKAKYFEHIGSILRWARIEQYVRDDLAGILKMPAKKSTGGYEPFSDDDLTRLFESEDYQHGTFVKASQFWIPLIGLYTGARITEIAQLHLSDIREQDGVWLIDINDDDLRKHLKSESATRAVPIHPVLIGVGLLRYHAEVKAEGYDRLFPDLTRTNKAKDSFGADPSEFFTGYRRRLGVTSKSETFDATTNKWTGRGTKVFHSLRDTANSKLRHAGVTQERRERLVGHASRDVNNKHYRPADINEMFPLSSLREDITKLDYGLTHASYIGTARHRRERVKGAQRQARIDAEAVT
ncbi:site-specific integrase [Caballeronia sp. LZ029]|uniref:site-specific integrase n=1 Tax=Caballeronia sp. LZ029 TaxID=3038564 RepID=UPI0028664515|nr:site-specific integrase [Caballeronia sp. LZ029]MDR5744440.1 site-specific integrase [Caballeronia sp. LZ029]